MLPDPAKVRFFLAVPTMAQLQGKHVIRLPRCGVCFDEVHDYQHGAAHCVAITGTYRAMDHDQLARWEAAERADDAAKAETREQP